MTKSNTSIEDSLGVRPMSEVKEEQENLPSTREEQFTSKRQDLAIIDNDQSDDEEMLADIDLARKNIEDIILKGGDSLEEMISLAKQSESPRAFEVASTLMKTLLDANKEFVDMAEKKKTAKREARPGGSSSTGANVTNNNLVISTTDLLKMMKGGNDITDE